MQPGFVTQRRAAVPRVDRAPSRGRRPPGTRRRAAWRCCSGRRASAPGTCSVAVTVGPAAYIRRPLSCWEAACDGFDEEPAGWRGRASVAVVAMAGCGGDDATQRPRPHPHRSRGDDDDGRGRRGPRPRRHPRRGPGRRHHRGDDHRRRGVLGRGVPARSSATTSSRCQRRVLRLRPATGSSPTAAARCRYEEIAQNAFYCPPDDLIAWDTDNLTNDLLDEFGAVHPRHRHGPRVRPRHPGPRRRQRDRTIVTEQQADCFAGAFTKFVADGDARRTSSIDVDDLDSSDRRLPLHPRPGRHRRRTIPAPTARASTASAPSRTASSTAPSPAPSTPTSSSAAAPPSSTSPSTRPTRTRATPPGRLVDPTSRRIFDLTLGSLEIFFDTDVSADAFDDHVGRRCSRTTRSSPSIPTTRLAARVPGRATSPPTTPPGIAFTCFGDDGRSDRRLRGLRRRRWRRELHDEHRRLRRRQPPRPAVLVRRPGARRATSRTTRTRPPGRLLQRRLHRRRRRRHADEGQGFPFNPDRPERPRSRLSTLGRRPRRGHPGVPALGEDADPDIAGTPFQRVTSFRDGFFNGLDTCATYLDGGAPDADELIAPDDLDRGDAQASLLDRDGLLRAAAGGLLDLGPQLLGRVLLAGRRGSRRRAPRTPRGRRPCRGRCSHTGRSRRRRA